MKYEEGKFKKEFADEAERWNAFVKVTHGNQFQSGLPDVHIVSAASMLSWVECKFWGNVGLPENFHQLHKQMKGAQINVIKHQMWKRSAACLLISQIGRDLDNCAVCYKDQFTIVPWKHLAKLLAISTDFSTVLRRVSLIQH